MSQAVLPPSEAPKVKFEYDPKHAKAPAYGMENIHDAALRALGRRVSGEEDLSESEIATKITDEYGGELLENALRIYRLMGEGSSSSHRNGPGPTPDPSSQATKQTSGTEKGDRVKCYSFDTPLLWRVSLEPTMLFFSGRCCTPPQAKLYVKPVANPSTTAPLVPHHPNLSTMRSHRAPRPHVRRLRTPLELAMLFLLYPTRTTLISCCPPFSTVWVA